MKIVETQDGSHSLIPDFADVCYHSKYGAIQESRHVFIESGLYHQLAGREKVKVLEMGFGTGLNAFLTMLASRLGNFRVEYTGVDTQPLPSVIFEKLNYAEKLGVEEDAVIFRKMHVQEWGTTMILADNFILTKLNLDFEEVVFDGKFDAVYYDAFAPNISPEHWEFPMVLKMFEVLNPSGVLVTYCAKGSFKRNLKAAGFKVESLKGPPGKREMTRAIKP